VITGASGGIGRATARRFGADGARVALMARGRRGVLPELRHHKSNVHVSMVQLPGVNTTQFTWSRTKLPKQTMPVPPIYQPEIAADAIHYAAHHKRRQIYVGIPTLMNILGERIAPWLLDRYLARSGFSSQMTDEPLVLVPQGHDNLFKPVDEDRGSHGPFDEPTTRRAISSSLPS